jgi:hypothetical protein
MKLSAFYKKQGWSVLFNLPLFPADKVYVSKVFAFSPPVSYPGGCVIGGPGHDIRVALPDAIDRMMPDYSLYNCDYSLGYTSRGCPNKCGFCIVPSSEGAPRVVGDIYSFWNKRHNKIVIMDSNILFSKDHFMRITEQVRKERLLVRFEQGLDIRRIDRDVACQLARIKYDRVAVSWDTREVEAAFFRGLDVLLDYVAPCRVLVHILTGFDTDFLYDYKRVAYVRHRGLSPFVMVYNKVNTDSRLSALQHWANSRYISNLPFYRYLHNHNLVAHFDDRTLRILRS